ncbi:dethiobiotin synthase [Tuwongella immobilis]|uniref:ATP-dependent dethiobiotin synthetase BioD n=1 Tax=Tuwongella immobilis TaxID=692036 RepID=A0A6C2YPE6_9BACT|nr:dethiobiotin synthase [Tuwongella immobilis]VIP03326.1 dethiobiotin synthetase : ATP-dependent dethiobiotin synthetase BioD OS=Singulisphaera acidiphila (strain ATCC BAA-1392 / DSM 18658 / VKM B-2454 / MOB10) GN=bioD PE=3 SV=1: AAA_26 [Tuwongella immobilis]VTS04023.1 dethiobiotin synthetase : ATP-dependent dethiobiotin synthetase BioD OS=Singulisphaera acidiphila (strain ATCC BAA-1392 / DSM 18658 / VKM B-2454 / MOB10) GN=bioD PE=3 SV=1: AAA_26 [Tuwongella immobilis]
MNALFITGTDTGVGKTMVTVLLTQLLREQGVAVRTLKPVASGVDPNQPDGMAEDTRAIWDAQGRAIPPERITPWRFREPAAPPVAAEVEGRSLQLAELVSGVQAELSPNHCLIVEGVGGLLCPLTETETVADWISALNMPTLIVTRRGLGTLNHTLLTVEAAMRRGISVVGLIVNSDRPGDSLAERTAVREIQRRIPLPIWAELPYTEMGRLDSAQIPELEGQRLRQALKTVLESSTRNPI